MRRNKFYEREKQKLWELAKKVSDREKRETAKERNGTSDGTVQEDGECSVINCVHPGGHSAECTCTLIPFVYELAINATSVVCVEEKLVQCNQS